jgi:5-methylcytosine-specific restriction endonuclease McrA
VLAIVETDVTFEKHPNKDMHHGLDVWVGKCIHCNRKLVVTYCGTTDATIEHVMPLCNDGQAQDVRNLALACKGCNNEKGIRHDRHAGRGGRADEVITALQNKRMSRWREPDVT